MQPKRISQHFFLTVTLIISGTLFALDSDREQDVLYSSDGISTSRTEGNLRIIRIEDNVKVTQGTLQITGDLAIFERETDSASMRKVSVTGKPARYQQQLDESGTMIHGDGADILYYFEDEPIVEFVGAANLRQQNDTLSCVSIKYFADSGYTEYTGPCSGVLSRPANNNGSSPPTPGSAISQPAN